MTLLIGAQEWCSLPELGIDRMRAKVDTGARTSALHAENIAIIHIDGKKFVEFHVESYIGESSSQNLCRVPLKCIKNIKSSNGITETRYVITTMIVFNGLSKMIDITLTNRKIMRFNLLLGREALCGDFIIDPSKRYVLTKKGKK